MRFRKLRITWSLVWGVVALLVIVLWVRSYWRIGYAHGHMFGTRQFDVNSRHGVLFISAYYLQTDINSPEVHTGWIYTSEPFDEQAANDVEFFHRGHARIVGSGFNIGYFRFHNGIGISRAVPTWLRIKTNYSGTGFVAFYPYWLLTSLVGVLAAAPWINRITWRRRFSLRTLVVATTLVAAVLALVVWSMR